MRNRHGAIAAASRSGATGFRPSRYGSAAVSDAGGERHVMSDRGRDDLASALRQLAQSVEVPPLDPDRERALLEAFDAAQQEKRAPAVRFGMWRPATAAAL